MMSSSSSSSSSSLSNAYPQIHQSIIDMGEDQKKFTCLSLDVNRVFPNDLKEFCSCADCDKKIKDLLDFDNYVIFLSKIIIDHEEELHTKENLCLSLLSASHWNKRVLNSFYNKLKSICEQSGIPLPIEKSPKLENAFNQLTRHLIDAKVINEDVLDAPSIQRDDICKNVDSGFYWYGGTKANDKAIPLLNEILEIVENHESSKKSVDPSFYIQLIKCLEKMPVDVLQAEVEELVEQICPVAKHMKTFMEAEKYVKDTCLLLVNEKREFRWKTRNSENQVKEHISNGLDKTLDMLLLKVDSFKKEWEKDYAHVFKYFDRSNPKRQRIAYC